MPPCYSTVLTIYTSIMIPSSKSYTTIIKGKPLPFDVSRLIEKINYNYKEKIKKN